MPYEAPSFKGDTENAIDCTGDCVVGDAIRFERAFFHGSFRQPTVAGFELVAGKIVADSYGADKQQHTFTIEFSNGTRTLIKVCNLYRNGVWRKTWVVESDRKAVVDEKHARGSAARTVRANRREINQATLP